MNGLDYNYIVSDKPFDCSICTNTIWIDDCFSTALVHEGGEKHPQCEVCVRKWTAAKDNPTCAICSAKINPQSILSKLECEGGAEKRKVDRAEKFQEQYGEDERVARALVMEDAGSMGRVFAPFIGDQNIARHLQTQEYRKQNPFCNPVTYVIAGVIFIASVVLIETFRS